MRPLFSVATPSFALACLVSGCAPAADSQDELAREAASLDALDGHTDRAVADAYTYFELTADLRRCASPLCGGWFLRRLNESPMTCHDGQQAETCYAPAIDWTEAHLTGAQQAELLEASRQAAVAGDVRAIVRGRLAPTNTTTPRPELGAFVVTEGWIAENDAISEGGFVKVKDNGIRCFAAPCPSLTEWTLNTPQVAEIAKADLTPARLTDVQLEECLADIAGPDGLLVTGDRYTVRVDGRTGTGRTATAVYRRLPAAAQ
jgi:hypothetical protein